MEYFSFHLENFYIRFTECVASWRFCFFCLDFGDIFFSFILYFLLLHVTTLHRYMYMAVVIYLYNYFVVGKCVNMCSEYPSSASFIVALFLFYFHSMSIHTLFGNVWCFNLFPFFPIHCSIAIPRRAVEQFYNRQLNIGCHHTKNFLLNITQSAF